MPWLQPGKAVYVGFIPYDGGLGGTVQVNPYLVSSSATIGTLISAGDVCVYTTQGTVRAMSSAGGVTSFTSSMSFVGVAANTLAAGAGSTGAFLNSNTSQMILLYDDPKQLFAVHDTTSGVIGSPLGLFKNYALLTTGAVGSTGPNTLGGGRSNMAINGVESSVAGLFHIVGMHPIESGVYSGSSGTALGSTDTRWWIGRFVTGVQVQPSTGVFAVANTSS